MPDSSIPIPTSSRCSNEIENELLSSFRELEQRCARQALAARELSFFYAQLLSHIKMPTRLQVRSFPQGAEIIIDKKHTGFVTPHTFTDLEPGEHTVDLHWFDDSGKLIVKSEKVVLEQDKRTVCKIKFIKPKTLAW